MSVPLRRNFSVQNITKDSDDDEMQSDCERSNRLEKIKANIVGARNE